MRKTVLILMISLGLVAFGVTVAWDVWVGLCALFMVALAAWLLMFGDSEP